ncbi:FAD-binding and (Fe-S)-binding domain-containing protein [Frigoriglobus tundricola]|uniref:Anaerobic glycerol-3-phosphate dehydrogenase subunit C n=1 Tax=Frigoriglobus tundricola TaxID=2774151 RepID=A0A6M5YV62_9BACT|nr:FAD-binding and (Fe-S)-binding domain-containing protein [Frigoriglobus tundricola]QJW97171.1 Anaerobic glycerol-3-phosphate dehydrogenase subunit C [Frigoriglobus tundricola]
MDFATERRDSLVRYLRRHVAGEVRFDDTSRALYSTDASHYQIRPLGVVVPRTADDLAVAVQVAADLNVPITARGAGTSLSGQSIGPGVVIDCSKYMNAVGEVDVTGRRVRVQPGVVLDQLNRALAPHGLMFGPDVATANRATLGGMIGNNSAGARSVVYGQTVDHVRALAVVLSDGTRAEFAPLSAPEYERKLELRTREGDAYRAAAAVVRDHAAEIVARTPQIVRKVSGYNLAGLIEPRRAGGVSPPSERAPSGRISPPSGTAPRGAHAPRPPGSLVPLLVGSEGTLAVVAEAELALVPRPKHRGLLVPQFASLGAALDALRACLELGPSAVELMDRMLIDLARTQRSLKDTMAAVRGRPEALLMVEFSSDDAADVSYRVHELQRRLAGAAGLTASVPALDAATRDPLWALRSSAVPLLYGMPGDAKPVTFCEDCAVAPERLPEFAARFREIFRRHGTDGAFYGHASVGCLHIRPVLDLHATAGVVTMRKIMEEVTDLVLAFGGSLSGEHGDGLVRSEWNRKMFGPVVYDAFRRVKRGFDPGNVLNPGKVVDAPAMEENMRVPPGRGPESDPPTVLDYSKQGGFFRSVELCNGAGVCRKTQGGAMCPSYRATRDERDTTRGRANALRLALAPPPADSSSPLPSGRAAGRGASRHSPIGQRWIMDVMDLCLSCKACKSECPSNVDVAKLKAEFLHAYYLRRARPLGHLLLKHIHRLSPLAARFAGANNWLARRPWVRGLMESAAGIDRRRSLPEWHRDHFRRWFQTRGAGRGARSASQENAASSASPRSVVLLDDCFTTFQEPQIGRAAVALLERAGFSVELAGICCGRAMLSKGFLTAARTLARDGVAKLGRYAEAGVPILGLEPSCIMALADEWPELVPGAAAGRVAAAAELAEGWLARQVRDKGLSLEIPPRAGEALLHPHCHQKALVGSSGTTDALKLVRGLNVTVLDAGCCGMAGAFGYEKQHCDVSVRIAGLELIPAVTANPAATLIATGTSCRHQIRDLTGRVALHPLEVLAGPEPR